MTANTDTRTRTRFRRLRRWVDQELFRRSFDDSTLTAEGQELVRLISATEAEPWARREWRRKLEQRAVEFAERKIREGGQGVLFRDGVERTATQAAETKPEENSDGLPRD